ncbi:ATP-grasp domain-containing protein [Blastococcus sp. VKM Ac-2987]|uniref:ATP-grasp domain-containing protein n=1 Tax=Blastococcus sp. VKM Ac-2987 TaxID=3004141 RepID=UPI0022AB95E5|nr:hypothetical protein [Blastococcus sp. VKM Ac-2987]MCZ2856937.1 hypothetical protein [Blastococcus sp. VKM Ac-2987]
MPEVPAGARVALVTSERGLPLDPDLPLAVPALVAAGLEPLVVRWDDPGVDWNAFALTVVRSCWDYTWRLPEFLGWAAQVPRLRNPVEVMRWNADKSYLRDLERAGVAVVPTVWAPGAVDELPEGAEWVVKPSVSAGSRDTARWTDPHAALAHAADLAAAGRVAMVQPYQASVDRAGETAMLFLGGRFSHAVRKGPLLRRGEGVRQDRDSRGDLAPVRASAAQRDAAESVLDAVAALLPAVAPLLYARIDLVEDPTGRPTVLEVELTEPSFFLPQAPHAAAGLAAAVADLVG